MRPIDDLLVFHIVFGKTVPDISLNAVANLGYAACRFLAPVFAGDTLSTVSEVIGLKENSNRQTGVVYRALRRHEPAWRDGARLCALGHGAEAR
jgi:acyl dehydratase